MAQAGGIKGDSMNVIHIYWIHVVRNDFACIICRWIEINNKNKQ